MTKQVLKTRIPFYVSYSDFLIDQAVKGQHSSAEIWHAINVKRSKWPMDFHFLIILWQRNHQEHSALARAALFELLDSQKEHRGALAKAGAL